MWLGTHSHQEARGGSKMVAVQIDDPGVSVGFGVVPDK